MSESSSDEPMFTLKEAQAMCSKDICINKYGLKEDQLQKYASLPYGGGRSSNRRRNKKRLTKRRKHKCSSKNKRSKKYHKRK